MLRSTLVSMKCKGLYSLLAILAFYLVTSGQKRYPMERIHHLMSSDVESFDTELKSFENLVLIHAGRAKLLSSYALLRKKFKDIEPFLSYYDPERYSNFNGADIMRYDKQIPGYSLYDPEGLQVIASHLYSTDTVPYQSIYNLCISLQHQTHLWKSYLLSLQLSSTDIIKAMYLQTIYIETLGLSGYDLIDKKLVALEQKYSIIKIVQIICLLQKDKVFSTEQKQEIKWLEQYINAKLSLDFDHIDRLDITKNGLQPLRRILLAAIAAKKTQYYSPLRFSTASLYDTGFINPLFYASKGYYNQGGGEIPSPSLIALGKEIFADTILSASSNLSCATCHRKEKAFTDGLPKSISNTTSEFLDRNTPTIIYAGYQSAYLYDMSASSLEDQLSHVIVNKKEFNTSYTTVLKNIASKPSYVTTFSTLFPEYGTNAIQIFTVNKALAAYVRSLGTFDSDFDIFMRGEKSIPTQAYNGYNIFMGKAGCGTCHFPPFFGGLRPPNYIETEAENIGVWTRYDTANPTLDNDEGLYNYLKNKYFIRQFKVPLLRNIAITAPYMHNGAFATLEQVLQFYNLAGDSSYKITNTHQTLPKENLLLTEADISNIIAFLHTLSDKK